MLIKDLPSLDDASINVTPRTVVETMATTHSVSPNVTQILVYAFDIFDNLLLLDPDTSGEKPSAEATLPSRAFVLQGPFADTTYADRPLHMTAKKLLQPYHLDESVHHAAIIAVEVGPDPGAFHDPQTQQLIIHVACRIQPAKAVMDINYWHGSTNDLVRYSCEHFDEEDRTLLTRYLDLWKKDSSTRTDRDYRQFRAPSKPGMWKIICQTMGDVPQKLRRRHRERVRQMDLWR